MFARVAFPIPYERYLTYGIPRGLERAIRRGSIVVAPLGSRPAVGVILELSEKPEIPVSGIKEIIGPGDTSLTVPSDLMGLAEFTAARYGTTPGMVLKSALPPGTLQRKKLYYYPGEKPAKDDVSPAVRGFIAHVSDNPGRLSHADLKRFKGISANSVDGLIAEGVIAVSPFKTSKRAGSKRKWVKATGRTIPDDIKPESRSYQLLEALIESPEGISVTELRERGFSTSLAASLSRKGLVEFEYRDREMADIGEMKSLVAENVLELTLWQKAVLSRIEGLIDSGNHKGILLYGVTSSGKTQVYLEAARYALNKGKSVLVLVPEISLTPQIVSRFERFMGFMPLVWHSRLTPSERATVFRKAKSGDVRLVIGARSSIFCPLTDLGLIVVDEEQDNSYKQVDPAPRYNARDLALERGRTCGATVILGSATPSAESFYAAMNGDLELHTLPQRVAGKRPPEIRIISTSHTIGPDERPVSVFPKNFWPVSRDLHAELSVRLRRGEQAIILLNRRGYSSSVVCFECGWLGRCPDCDIGWTYHKARDMMICHFCGNEQPGLTICPECGSSRLSFRGAGTERLEETLGALFPEARIKRLDSDAATAKWGSRDILDEFGEGKIDLLVGTQMVAKGHHFPEVGFAAVIGAEVGLSLPDFRATERVMQLLTQAAGRAGRSSRKLDHGLVMIQTYSPKNPIFGYLLKDDYTGFLKKELDTRRALGYPPFSRIILVVVSSSDPSKAAAGAEKIKSVISGEFKSMIISALGPAKAAIFKRGKEYRYQLMLKVRPDADYDDIIAKINGAARAGRGFSVRLDIDPVSFL